MSDASERGALGLSAAMILLQVGCMRSVAASSLTPSSHEHFALAHTKSARPCEQELSNRERVLRTSTSDVQSVSLEYVRKLFRRSSSQRKLMSSNASGAAHRIQVIGIGD